MQLDPHSLAQEDRYRLLIGLIVPRPIAWVSTMGPGSHDRPGPVNLAPFSFFNGVGSNPLMLLFCPANKPDGSEKDTLRNCKPPAEADNRGEIDPDDPAWRAGTSSAERRLGGAGEFVVNIVDEGHATRMAACAEPLAYGESEFEFASVASAPSVIVKPPRVAEAPASFECITHRILRTNPGQPGGGNIVIGRVVHVHVRDDLADEKFRARFHTDPAKLKAIGRMGGQGYCRTADLESASGANALSSRFEMLMGKGALFTHPLGQESRQPH
jgi:flavin reductase (DIM6/NTAB) family NADH-FMN oxidoreductase RutF